MTQTPPPPPALSIQPSGLVITEQSGKDGVALTIFNPSKEASVLYKCKTTSPSRYVVKHRRGVIAPEGTVQVLITLQRGFTIPHDDIRDTFLVEARTLLPGEAERVASDTDYTALMKKFGSKAIAKTEIPCDLAAGATGRGEPRSETASQHTQPSIARRSGDAASPQSVREPSAAQAATPPRQAEVDRQATAATAQPQPTPAAAQPPAAAGASAAAAAAATTPAARTSQAPPPKKSDGGSGMTRVAIVVGLVAVAAYAYTSAGADAPATTAPTPSAASSATQEPKADKTASKTTGAKASSAKGKKGTA